jgi:hypothetical protein
MTLLFFRYFTYDCKSAAMRSKRSMLTSSLTPMYATVVPLMNGSLRIPTPVGAMIVASTRAKMTELPHKTKRGERLEPCKPLNRVWRQVQFSFLRADQHVLASSPIFNERDQAASLLSGMTDQHRHGRLTRLTGRRQSQSVLVHREILDVQSRHVSVCVVLPLFESLQRQVRELGLQGRTWVSRCPSLTRRSASATVMAGV